MQFPHCHGSINVASLSPILSVRGCNSASSAELLWGVYWDADQLTDMTPPCLSSSVLTSSLGEVTPKLLSNVRCLTPAVVQCPVPASPRGSLSLTVSPKDRPRKGNRSFFVLYLRLPCRCRQGYSQAWLTESLVLFHQQAEGPQLDSQSD